MSHADNASNLHTETKAPITQAASAAVPPTHSTSPSDAVAQHIASSATRPAPNTESIRASRPRGIHVLPDEEEQTLTLLFMPGADEQVFGNWAMGFNRTHPGSWRRVIVDITACRLLNSTFYSGLVILHQDFPDAEVTLVGASKRIVQTLKILCIDSFITVSENSSEKNRE